MEYVPQNSGILAVSMVKAGDKILILEEATSKFVPANQKTYWNVKVELPDKTHKLAGLMDSICDEFAKAWGNNTVNWIGHTAVVEIKKSKSGNPYIMLKPTNDPVVDIEALRVEKYKEDVAKIQEKNEESGNGNVIEYPEEEINPDDIPF